MSFGGANNCSRPTIPLLCVFHTSSTTTLTCLTPIGWSVHGYKGLSRTTQQHWGNSNLMTMSYFCAQRYREWNWMIKYSLSEQRRKRRISTSAHWQVTAGLDIFFFSFQFSLRFRFYVLCLNKGNPRVFRYIEHEVGPYFKTSGEFPSSVSILWNI